MKVCVVGSGYVGLVSGVGFAEFGMQVACVDHDEAKIAALNRGEAPIYEPGLAPLLARNLEAGRLTFHSDTTAAVRAAEVVFIAVQTPPAEDGSSDLSAMEAAARAVGAGLSGFKVIAVKSTVPPGSAAKIRQWAEAGARAAGLQQPDFAMVANPEFLREGSALADFMHPDRVVIGADDPRALQVLKEVYRPLYLNETPFVETSLVTAELIKYASNAFLATKVSFINETADLCEALGADVQVVARAMGLDGRIGPKFLHAGPGFGGSCFPKDTRSAAHFARAAGERFEIVEAVIRVNDARPGRMIDKIKHAVGGELAGKRIGVLGLSFKPETDDVRCAPALEIIRGLLEAGAEVRAFDPAANAPAAAALEGFTCCEDAYQVCKGADALVLATEWNQFRMLDLARVQGLLAQPVLVDLRNIYEPEALRAAGFEYISVGR